MLADQSVLITGPLSGIGFATARPSLGIAPPPLALTALTVHSNAARNLGKQARVRPKRFPVRKG
jgi:hypothetical protein